MTNTGSRELAGKNAFISGGTSGINLAIARRYAAEGANVCVIGRDSAKAERAGREIAREGACELQPRAGRIARADDRDHRARQRFDPAAHAEQGRRIVDHGEPRWITGFAGREQADADLVAGDEFGTGLLLAADAALPGRAATPR